MSSFMEAHEVASLGARPILDYRVLFFGDLELGVRRPRNERDEVLEVLQLPFWINLVVPTLSKKSKILHLLRKYSGKFRETELIVGYVKLISRKSCIVRRDATWRLINSMNESVRSTRLGRQLRLSVAYFLICCCRVLFGASNIRLVAY